MHHSIIKWCTKNPIRPILQFSHNCVPTISRSQSPARTKPIPPNVLIPRSGLGKKNPTLPQPPSLSPVLRTFRSSLSSVHMRGVRRTLMSREFQKEDRLICKAVYTRARARTAPFPQLARVRATQNLNVYSSRGGRERCARLFYAVHAYEEEREKKREIGFGILNWIELCAARIMGKKIMTRFWVIEGSVDLLMEPFVR